jgi:hypothetical protein
VEPEHENIDMEIGRISWDRNGRKWFEEKLLVLLVIAGVILVLIFILAIQISRSYFSKKIVFL